MSQYPQIRTKPFELQYGTDNKVIFNFLNAVYAWMAVALAVTAAVAWYVSHSMSALQFLYGSGKGAVVFMLLGCWGLAWAAESAAVKISAALGTVLFMLYAACIGALISGIFIIYPIETIGASFLVTGGTFAGMSIYGYVTKRDLSGMHGILVMLAFGLIIASIVNLFVASTAFGWLLTYGILIVFVLLVATQTQRLKEFAEQNADNANIAARYAVVGSIMLYITFINIFMSVLRIMGGRK